MAGRSQRHMRAIQGRDASRSTYGSRKAPLVNAKPTIAGTATSGQTLTGTNGTFTAVAAGGANSAITREWMAGTTSLGTGATLVLSGATYTAAKGKRVVLRNYCSNRFGKRVSESLATAVVP